MISKVVKVTLGHSTQLKYNGVFDLDRLYSEVVGWFGEMGYDLSEKEHSDKDKSKGKYLKYKFSAEREVTDYFKFYIDVTFDIVEVVPVSGNLVKGKARIFIVAKLELDHHGHWEEKGKFVDFMFKVYNNYIIKDRISQYAGILTKEVVSLHDLMKDVLDFNR